MMTDPISDMLTRIRNANQRFHKTVWMFSSKIKLEIIKIFKKEGFIENFTVVNSVQKKIIITLKYKGKTKIISGLKRISKPGLRVYTKVNKIPKVLNGFGVSIISTSKGIVTGKFAQQLKLGGEVIAYIW